MWKELLSKLALSHPYVTLNHPASRQEIIEAETKLSVRFPEELKECFLEVNGDGDVLFSIGKLVDVNLMMRQIYQDNNLLRVATNGCGDDVGYVVDENGLTEDPNIYYWDHEKNETQFFSTNLKEALIALYAD